MFPGTRAPARSLGEFRAALSLALIVLASAVPSASAQFTGQPGAGKEVVLTAPSPGKVDDPPVILPYAFLLLLGAAAIGANLIPSKRGHQD